MSLVKICGLSTPETLAVALDSGADMVGFVRFARSPRHVALDVAAELSRQASGRARRVLLMVDPADPELDQAVAVIAPDIVQLHGHESPDRVTAIRARTGRPIMKALPVAESADLAPIELYRRIADHILLDAKPPKDALLPGGNGVAFDWTLVEGLSRPPLCVALGASGPALDPSRQLVLSGGLNPDNVAEAIRVSGLGAVDVSSGVESAPGIKDPARIAAFCEAARAAFAAQDQNRRVA